ncbi:MAG: hypothetical protein CMJ78_00255 [Planctomycetaceae bacterium]|nr:hypothetical protein [Planctomycetaceae bacterium]
MRPLGTQNDRLNFLQQPRNIAMKNAAISSLALFVVCLTQTTLWSQSNTLRERDVRLDESVSLHMIEQGTGEPIVFIHGISGDYQIWQRQVAAFAQQRFRAISYSRRYNYPNDNPLKPNHSAVVEADDLDRLLTKLEIDKAHIVGHSYGGYTALMFALKHPKRVRTLILCEPPLVTWLDSITGEKKAAAKAHREGTFSRFVNPSKTAFEMNDTEKAWGIFFDFFVGEGAQERMPPAIVARVRRNPREVQALTSSKNIYPEVARDDVKQLSMPVLIMSGSRTTGVAQYTDDELERLLPESTTQRATFDTTHMMWQQQPVQCRNTVVRFIREAE